MKSIFFKGIWVGSMLLGASVSDAMNQGNISGNHAHVLTQQNQNAQVQNLFDPAVIMRLDESTINALTTEGNGLYYVQNHCYFEAVMRQMWFTFGDIIADIMSDPSVSPEVQTGTRLIVNLMTGAQAYSPNTAVSVLEQFASFFNHNDLRTNGLGQAYQLLTDILNALPNLGQRISRYIQEERNAAGDVVPQVTTYGNQVDQIVDFLVPIELPDGSDVQTAVNNLSLVQNTPAGNTIHRTIGNGEVLILFNAKPDADAIDATNGNGAEINKQITVNGDNYVLGGVIHFLSTSRHYTVDANVNGYWFTYNCIGGIPPVRTQAKQFGRNVSLLAYRRVTPGRIIQPATFASDGTNGNGSDLQQDSEVVKFMNEKYNGTSIRDIFLNDTLQRLKHDTILTKAVRSGNPKIVKNLLNIAEKQGADFQNRFDQLLSERTENGQGITPLHLALRTYSANTEEFSYKEIFGLLSSFRRSRGEAVIDDWSELKTSEIETFGNICYSQNKDNNSVESFNINMKDYRGTPFLIGWIDRIKDDQPWTGLVNFLSMFFGLTDPNFAKGLGIVIKSKSERPLCDMVSHYGVLDLDQKDAKGRSLHDAMIENLTLCQKLFDPKISLGGSLWTAIGSYYHNLFGSATSLLSAAASSHNFRVVNILYTYVAEHPEIVEQFPQVYNVIFGEKNSVLSIAMDTGIEEVVKKVYTCLTSHPEIMVRYPHLAELICKRDWIRQVIGEQLVQVLYPSIFGEENSAFSTAIANKNEKVIRALYNYILDNPEIEKQFPCVVTLLQDPRVTGLFSSGN